MPNNPLFNSKSAPNGATDSGNNLNDASKRYARGRNTFNYSRKHYTSARYADITPFEAINCVEGDIMELGSKHLIRTHTLSSTLMSDVVLKRSYCYVDKLAILPLNWHKIYQEPTFGDDIDASKANTFVPNFFRYFQEISDNISRWDIDSFSSDSYDLIFSSLLHYLEIFEHVFSNGSPLALLGFHASPIALFVDDDYKTYHDLSFDKAFEVLISRLSSYMHSDKPLFDILYDNGSSDVKKTLFSFRELFNIVRYYHSWRVSWNTDQLVDEADYDEYSNFLKEFQSFFNSFRVSTSDESQIGLNYERLAAYQIACCNFFTRDSVDDIITAKLYREAMQGCIDRYSDLSPNYPDYDGFFDYNGNRYRYDALSGFNLDYVIFEFTQSSMADYVLLPWDNSYEGYLDAYLYFMNLFGFQRSLRYGDYFTGAKPRPIAVGDITAEVTDAGVNAIDMTVALLRARFGNAVNRAGRSPEDYIEEVMDGVYPPEADEPRLLASIASAVTGFEVENTAESQGDIVTLLKSGDSKNVYQFAVGTPSIVIGLLTFDVQRVYSRTADRFFFDEDRYDMFNKFMQYSGDQKIIASERDTASDQTLDGLSFAYTLHDMHYKQRFPIATGAFVDFLPSYLFVTDNDETGLPGDDPIINITPDYVRSRNGEFDRFYKSLTNYSLAGYYHFFISFDNICIAHRKMEYKPTIL